MKRSSLRISSLTQSPPPGADAAMLTNGLLKRSVVKPDGRRMFFYERVSAFGRHQESPDGLPQDAEQAASATGAESLGRVEAER